jgi:mono/diheme cytochrome c family protein
MPAFGHTLSDNEIKAVLLYLKSLWGPQERAFQAEVSKHDPFP